MPQDIILANATPLVYIALVAWFPVVCLLFLLLPARRAVLIAYLGAWLFLPIAEFQIKFFPEYNKVNVTSMSVLVAALAFDTARIVRFRPKWIDLPMLLFCISPMASALTNGLGVYSGLSQVFRDSVRWGLPYFIGRIYFNDLAGLRELLLGVVIGGLVYVPFCLYEVRMSPQLHRIIYGYHQHIFSQQIRGEGYRPMVFMTHGLQVALWMMTATLAAFGLWQRGSVKHLMGLPMPLYIVPLAVTTVLCKTSGAYVLMAIGIAMLIGLHFFRSALPLIVLASMPVGYMLVRATGLYSGESLISAAETVFGPDRALSLQTRIRNENILTQKALQRPVFGWSGFGRSRVRDEQTGRDISRTDGMWVIILGTKGLFGLVTFTMAILLPFLFLRNRASPRLWPHPAVWPAVVTSVILGLWMINCLPNSVEDPAYLLMVGGLSGLPTIVASAQRRKRVPAPTTESEAA